MWNLVAWSWELVYRDFVLDNNYFTISNSDTFLRPKKGRPFGGKTWIVKKSIKVIKHAFINKYVSFLHFHFSDKAFLVLGVCLPFDNSCHDSPGDFLFIIF